MFLNLLSKENGGIRHSKCVPSALSILNVPLIIMLIHCRLFHYKTNKMCFSSYIKFGLSLTTCVRFETVKRHDLCIEKTAIFY